MRTVFLVLIFSIPLTITAQEETSGFNCLHSVVEEASLKTYRSFDSDTLFIFSGSKGSYTLVSEMKYRSDTILQIEGSTVKLRADTIASQVTIPPFKRRTIPLVPILIDTIRNPDDNNLIVNIVEIDSITVEYAELIELNPTNFFQAIRKVEQMAKSQGINTLEIFISSPYRKKRLHLEIMKEGDFEDVEFLKASFLLEKNGNMMLYPVLFEKTDR